MVLMMIVGNGTEQVQDMQMGSPSKDRVSAPRSDPEEGDTEEYTTLPCGFQVTEVTCVGT